MKIGLETESYHLQFMTGRMDIFEFIRKTAELGLDGVMINIVKWPNLPGWGTLASFEPEYLARVKAEIQKYGFFAEIDTNGTDPARLEQVIEVAHSIGADIIRTYVCMGTYDEDRMNQAPDNIRQIVPLLQKYRIKLALENHEEELSSEVIRMIDEVDSPWVRAHCDVGNAMMAWEDPVHAVRKLAPYAVTTHFKDHIIVHDGDDYLVCGVPVGTGNIDLEQIFRTLVESSTLTRINVEMCYPYAVSFKREPAAGGVSAVGEGAFAVRPTPYDLSLIKPLDYYDPPQELLEKMIEDQAKGVEQSVQYTLALRDKYCR
ncbi:sugar phosphate isomerase/epimerase family protein [Paenibacillus guangzhouensis]|uniref:sugar phosphate isomerase/epimerase family protein n=1 Tax=Paenibacillus guangzhouensis TaxID=1473112 RepID=UPI001266A8E0|nr:sugar phosphate isomerase/epimerase family protein [Paenibacillus guangzhouensis]